MVQKLFYIVLAISIGLLIYAVSVLYFSSAALDDVPPDYILGAPEGDLTVVEFVDYNCPYCRAVHPVFTEAVERDGKVRYIPLPVTKSGNPSEYATRFTYAAGMQGKYKEAFQEFITGFSAPFDESQATDMALKLGLDPAKILEDASSDAVTYRMNKSAGLYLSMGGERTPTFFIGRKIKFAALPTASVEDFLRVFQEARAQ